jgi:hypothetical protein
MSRSPLPSAEASLLLEEMDELSPVARAIRLRDELRRKVDLLNAEKWSRWRGIAGRNPSAAIGKYKAARRVFAVHEGRHDLYPRFQFNERAEPLAGMAMVLEHVPPELDGWSLLSWFEAGNQLLGGSTPSALLAREPERVADAAKHYYARD